MPDTSKLVCDLFALFVPVHGVGNLDTQELAIHSYVDIYIVNLNLGRDEFSRLVTSSLM
jgi:hypothetical protein